MFIHRIQTFQIWLQIFKNLHICFISVFSDNFLRLFCQIRCIGLRIAGVSHNGISTYSNCIQIAAFFVKGHIHFVGHNKVACMFPYFFVKFFVHRMPHQNHNQTYHGFTSWKTTYNSQNSPYCHSCPVGIPCHEKNKKRKRK